MELLKGINKKGFITNTKPSKVRCRVFEDNNRALEMAKVHKFQPQTKHLNIKLYHFCKYVNSKQITIHAIKSAQQVADYLAKPINKKTFKRLRKEVMGW